MIYVTGDLHGEIDIRKLSTDNFPQQKELSKDDYLIILGDFGLVWGNSKEEIHWRDWLTAKPWTTLFIDGNHENFDLLYTFPTKEMFGGKVREISPSIFHLTRGQVFTIEDQKFFVMGGATSHDQGFRREYISWWRQEMPSCSEMTLGLESLEKHGFSVDYILSHCAPTSIQQFIADYFEPDALTDYLEQVKRSTYFKLWYFGHYHIDKMINGYPNFIAMYDSILPIKPCVTQHG